MTWEPKEGDRVPYLELEMRGCGDKICVAKAHESTDSHQNTR